MKKLLIILSSLFLMNIVVSGQDTLRQKDQTKLQTQKKDRIHQEDHLVFTDGKLYRWQNGVRSQVQSQVQLRNGGVANPDGSYQLRNQERLQLQNGECLDMDGNQYKNQERFNQRRMMTKQEMQQIREKQKQQQKIKTQEQQKTKKQIGKKS